MWCKTKYIFRYYGLFCIESLYAYTRIVIVVRATSHLILSRTSLIQTGFDRSCSATQMELFYHCQQFLILYTLTEEVKNLYRETP